MQTVAKVWSLLHCAEDARGPGGTHFASLSLPPDDCRHDHSTATLQWKARIEGVNRKAQPVASENQSSISRSYSPKKQKKWIQSHRRNMQGAMLSDARLE